MPWSKFTCTGCGSVYAGTLLRLVLISLSTGITGFVLIAVIKGKMNPLFLPPPIALTLAALFLDLPFQVRRVGGPTGGEADGD